MPPKRKHSKAIPEEDILSDDEEPKTITLTKEQRLTKQIYHHRLSFM